MATVTETIRRWLSEYADTESSDDGDYTQRAFWESVAEIVAVEMGVDTTLHVFENFPGKKTRAGFMVGNYGVAIILTWDDREGTRGKPHWYMNVEHVVKQYRVRVSGPKQMADTIVEMLSSL